MSLGLGFAIGRRRQRHAIGAPVVVSTPAGYSFTGPYQPTISRLGSGAASTFVTDYNLAARKALITPVQTIFVRKAGSNNNNGLTQGTAVRSLDLAMRMANAFGTATRIDYEAAALGAPRVQYLRTATQARSGGVLVNGVNLDATYTDCWQTYPPVVDLIVEPSVAGGIADSLLDVGALTFAATADPNIYSHAAGSSRVAFDYANLDDKGCPIRLAPLLTTPANTSAPWPEMNALWALYSGLPKRGGGTYATGVSYYNGTTLFIRAADNRNLIGGSQIVEAPTSQINPVLRADTASGGSRRFVIDGLGVMGGTAGCISIRGDNSFRARVDLANCRFFGATDGRGVVPIQPSAASGGGGADVIAVNCAANGGNRDGWNVSGNATLITINCIGDWNGWEASTFNNGYTFHDTSVGIDVNGSFRNNQDRSVQHVHDGMNWQLGSESGTRRGADATDISIAFALNGAGNTGTRQIWFDTPKLFNGPNGAPQHNYGVWTGSTINYANAAVTPGPNPAGWAGALVSYVA